MPMMEGTTRLKTWTGQYSFAVSGGAVGPIALTSNDGPIPTGSVITGGFAEVTTAGDSADDTGTLALSVEGANDLITAAAVSGAPWSTTGRKSIVPAGTGATSVKTTAARTPVATIAVQDLTGGVVNLTLFYK